MKRAGADDSLAIAASEPHAKRPRGGAAQRHDARPATDNAAYQFPPPASFSGLPAATREAMAEGLTRRMLSMWEAGPLSHDVVSVARRAADLDGSQMAPFVCLFCCWARDPRLLQPEEGREVEVAWVRDRLQRFGESSIRRALGQLRSMPRLPLTPETRLIDVTYSRMVGDPYDARAVRDGEDDLAQCSRADAQFSLALILGPGEEYVRLLRLAAQEGHVCAQSQLGLLAFNGAHGVRKDPEEAARLFVHAASCGLSSAQFALGAMYEQGTAGIERSPAEAVRLYRAAVVQGNKQAQYRLADLLCSGWSEAGLEKNVAEAQQLAKMSADQGNPHAMLLLGLMLERGDIEPTEEGEAEGWFRRAAERGLGEGFYFLGAAAESKGEFSEAIAEYTKAASRGHAAAAERATQMLLRGEGVSQDVRCGVSLLKEFGMDTEVKKHSTRE